MRKRVIQITTKICRALSIISMGFLFVLKGWALPPSEETFIQLLETHKKYPIFYATLDKVEQSLIKNDIDPTLFNQLSEAVKKSRTQSFNKRYLQALDTEHKIQAELLSLKKRLEVLPVTHPQYPQEEQKLKLRTQNLNQAQEILFVMSVNANRSYAEALKTLPSSQKNKIIAAKREESAKKSAPKMPGIWRGSAEERRTLKLSEKPNLTPVDPEFYQTQLGQKLEKDLGGRAEYWSYDFDKDELYVSVNNDVGKLQVKTDPVGTRFIQTRTGSQFIEPRGSDARVDLREAQGRFLTGNTKDESLFGKFPQGVTENYVDESQVPKHKGSSGASSSGH